jgi:diacylglycerol O-acyltransferase / wax synthase
MGQHIRLSIQDRMFLLAETRETPMHVGGLHVFKLPRGASPHFVTQLFDEFRTHAVSVPPLNYRLTGDLASKVLPSWEVVDAVDLDYHVRHSALPDPGGERELGVLVSRLHSTPMDLSRPLWEYHLIEGLTGGRFAVYIKLHHAMVDGAASMRLANMTADPADSYRPPFWADPSLRPQEPETRSNTLLGQLPATIQDEVRSLPSLLRGLATTARTAFHIAAPADLASMGEAPRTLFNTRVGAQRRVTTYAVTLARLRAIGKAAGGTINDVVLAVCSGALRRYLSERDALPEHSLIVAVPMALHHEAGAAGGNAVSCLIARLGTDVEGVRERFGVICRGCAAGKAQLKEMTPTAAMHFATLLSVPMLVSWLPSVDKLIGPTANLIVSNLPGPRERLYLHGARMLAHYPVSQVGHGMALNITVLSYAGSLHFGIVACPESVPNVQRLAAHLAAAMQELEITFLGTAAPKAGRKPGRVSRPSSSKRAHVSRGKTREGPRLR